MIFFGANDSCLPETTGQHIPLEVYRENLKYIATHSTVRSHGARLILVTPPPIDERLLEAHCLEQGIYIPTRTSEHTKIYANAAREIGSNLGLEVLDLWSVFMEHVGWKEGEPLPGSKKVAENELLQSLLCDGKYPWITPSDLYVTVNF